jgi:hypothetical protein
LRAGIFRDTAGAIGFTKNGVPRGAVAMAIYEVRSIDFDAVQGRAMDLAGVVTMKVPKITLKLVRSFSLGFTILSPKLNGVCFHVNAACFEIGFWNRGGDMFGFRNYWAITDFVKCDRVMVTKCTIGYHDYRLIDGVPWCDECGLEADMDVCKLTHHGK